MADNRFKVRLEAFIDKSSLSNVQKEILKQKLNLNVDISLKDFVKTQKDMESQVKSLATNIKNILGDAVSDKQANQWAKKYFNEQINGAKQAAKEQENLAKADAKVVEKIEQVRIKTEETRKAEEKRQQLLANTAHNKALLEEYNLRQKIAGVATNITNSMNGTGSISYNNQIQKLINDYQTLGLTQDEARAKVSSLQEAHNRLQTILTSEVSVYSSLEAKNKAIIEADKQRTVALNQVTNAYKTQAAQTGKAISDQARLATANRIQQWADGNTKAMKKYGAQINELITKLLDLNSVMYQSDLSKINASYQSIVSDARSSGLLGLNVLDKLKNAWSKFGGWSIATGSLMRVVSIIRQIPEEVTKVNTSVIELTKVSDASATEITNYFSEATESAKDLGASISDVISATADFSRLGYDLPDASELANIATLYKNVGDGIDIDESSSSIVSTMKAFKIEANDAISIVDKFNEVGNNFAISSGGIGDALTRSASSLAVANNTLSESIGLITAANTVVQDVEKVGTALKTVSLRMTSTSAELEELGEDTEFACETMSDYRDLVMGLTHNRVNILGDDGEYKSTYQMLSEISDVWTEMNSMEQSSLMKALFGTRQANIGASILENFDIAREAMQTAEESAGKHNYLYVQKCA